ncbi:MAG: hypothetical protein AAF497_27735, partial [Planctomycetota bacterium]
MISQPYGQDRSGSRQDFRPVLNPTPDETRNTSKPSCFQRREFLRQGTLGIGALALSDLLSQDSEASELHHQPKAKNVIFL